MNIFKLSIVATVLMTSSSTFAEGAIAGFLRDSGLIDEEQRRVLDGAHAAMDNPLDRAAEAAANYFVPGSVEAYRRAQQMSNNFPQAPLYQSNQRGFYPNYSSQPQYFPRSNVIPYAR